MAAAPVVVAPAVSIAAITGALLLLCAVLLVLYGLLYGYDYTLGALLSMLADVLDFKVWRVRINLAGQVEALNDTIRDAIGKGIDTVEKEVGRTFEALEWVIREAGDAIVAFGEDMHDAIAGIVYGEIPRAVGAATQPIAVGLGDFRRSIRRLVDQELARFARGIDGLTRDLTAEALARQRGIDWLGDRLGSVVMPRIRGLEQKVADVYGYTRGILRARVGRLEKLLAAGALGAVAIAAMTRVFPYWQCTNVRRANRMLCRLPVGLLDDIAGLGFAALVLTDVCKIGAAVRQVANLAQQPLLELVAVVDAATECTSFPKPPDLPLAAAALPTPAGTIAL